MSPTPASDPPLDPGSTTPRRVHFADFALDLSTFELERQGEPVGLQPQPGRLLALLIAQRGQVVRRDEIRQQLWEADTHVEYEQAINFTIRKIRIALGETASDPAFVETVPKIGYRFIAPVRFESASQQLQEPDRLETPPTAAERGAPFDHRAAPPPRLSPQRTLKISWVAGLSVLAVIALTLVAIVGGSRHQEDADRQEGVDRRDDHDFLGDSSRQPTTRLREAAQTTTVEPPAEILEQRLLEARHWIANPHLNKTQDAVDQLLRLVASVPERADVHLELAQGSLDLAAEQRFANFMPQVERAAERAIALDPGLARAHQLRATALFFYRHRWREAEESVLEALRLQPDLAAAVHLRGIMLSAHGEHERALVHLRRAIALDPATLWIASDLAFGNFYAGNLQETLEITRANLRTDPDDWANLFLHASARLLLDDDEAAAKAMARTYPGAADASVAQTLAWHRAAYELQLDMGLRGNTMLGLLQAIAGNDEEAMAHLRRACADDPGWELPFLGVDPRFARLRQRADFAQLRDCFPPQR